MYVKKKKNKKNSKEVSIIKTIIQKRSRKELFQYSDGSSMQNTFLTAVAYNWNNTRSLCMQHSKKKKKKNSLNYIFKKMKHTPAPSHSQQELTWTENFPKNYTEEKSSEICMLTWKSPGSLNFTIPVYSSRHPQIC